MAIDFGTSYTVAAAMIDGEAPVVLELGGERRIPSVILVDSDRIVVGRVAEEMAGSRPDEVLRAPKSRLGDQAPVVLRGRTYRAGELIAALLGQVYADAVSEFGRPPREVRLTHPATWTRTKQARLLEAAALAGLVEPTLVPEPVAAALAYWQRDELPTDGHVAIYDLGGGTFDTAVLQATVDGFRIVGHPGGDGSLGGELFDEMVVNLIGDKLDPATWESIQSSTEPSWRRLGVIIRTEARRAKETLSSYPYADVLLPLPSGLAEVRIDRTEFERVLAPYLEDSIALMRRCIADAGLAPEQLAAIQLVGGSSRIPAVEACVRDEFPGVAVHRRGDPKSAVALGALLASNVSLTPAPTNFGSSEEQPTPPTPILVPPASPPPPPVEVRASSIAGPAAMAERPPTVFGPPPPPPAQRGPVLAAPLPGGEPTQSRKRLNAGLLIGIVAVLVAAAVGVLYAMSSDEPSSDASTTIASESASTTPASLSPASSPLTASPPATESAGPTSVAAADPPATAAATVPQSDVLACLAADGSVDDDSFNQLAYEGLSRASTELGVQTSVLEATGEDDRATNIATFVDQGCSVIITVGFLFDAATGTAANAHPDRQFAIVDSEALWDNGTPDDFADDVALANVRPLLFEAQEAAFLAGYLAAGTTVTGKVGTYGGLDTLPVRQFMEGFTNGVLYFNQQTSGAVEVESAFVDTFTDVEAGRRIAQEMAERGVDIIFPVAGNVGLGSAAFATESGGALRIIGVDVDMYESDQANRAVYLTSVLKNIDVAVFDTIRNVVETGAAGEPYVGQLSNSGVGLAPFHDQDSSIPQSLKDELAQLQQGIIDGTIDVNGGS